MTFVRYAALTAIVLIATASRLIPHPPNFTPLAALALFAGSSFPQRRAALIVPLGALILSDVFLGFYEAAPFVYAGFALIVCLGFWVRREPSLWRIAVGCSSGSVLFYLISNFGVWLTGNLYAKTWSGLIDCYVVAVPFFRNTILSDAFYCALLFGAMALLERSVPAVAERA